MQGIFHDFQITNMRYSIRWLLTIYIERHQHFHTMPLRSCNDGLPYFYPLQIAYVGHPYMRDYTLWHTDLPARPYDQIISVVLTSKIICLERRTSVNSDGRRRRAADTAALRLAELMFLMSKLSVTIWTCMQPENLVMDWNYWKNYEIDMPHKSEQIPNRIPSEPEVLQIRPNTDL